jgi:hypothetical protein
MSVPLSDKVDFKNYKKRKIHWIMKQWSIQKEYTTVANIYSSNIKAPEYVKPTLAEMKGERNCNTVVVVDFTAFSSADWSHRKQRNMRCKWHARSNGHNRHHRTFHETAIKYTIFSTAYRIFSKVDHMLGHNTYLNKLKEIISWIFAMITMN